jgi:hypothetical protein
MSYATLLDALFALDLTDSELRDSTSRRLRRRATLEEESIPGVHRKQAEAPPARGVAASITSANV